MTAVKISQKNEFVSSQTLSHLFGTAQFVKCRQLFLALNSQKFGLYPCSNTHRKSVHSMSVSSIKSCIRRLHVIVVCECQRNVLKSVMHMCRAVVLLIKPIYYCFLTLLSSSLSLLKVPTFTLWTGVN